MLDQFHPLVQLTKYFTKLSGIMINYGFMISSGVRLFMKTGTSKCDVNRRKCLTPSFNHMRSV